MDLKTLFKKYVVNIPVLGFTALLLFRFWFASGYVFNPVKKMLAWLFSSREVDNFTYDLTPRNTAYLAAFISTVSGRPISEIENYINELKNDSNLAKHLTESARSVDSRYGDLQPRYGRRLGWYALVRATKPKVIVETGVDKGLGACVLAAALLRNKMQGYTGHYYGTELNPEGGYLLGGEYGKVGTILYGDSIASLKKFDQKIDLFINDSDHSSFYEAKEYGVIKNKLAKKAIVVGDNAHSSIELLAFARRYNRKFLFFQENPSNHWYPGGGIGVCY